MSALNDLFHQLTNLDAKLITRWQRQVNRQVRRFVRTIASSSPYLDKPKGSIFGIRNNREGDSLTLFGTSPNTGRMKAFAAPIEEWVEVPKTFRILGAQGWRTIKKAQKVYKQAGTPVQDVSYFGTTEKPEKFFGIRRGKEIHAYGRTEGGIALPIYAKDSFADWIMEQHKEEIDRIVLEAGQDVLWSHVSKGDH